MPRLDHLVFVAPQRDGGAAWMTDRLGVAPAGGGVHPDMGTHNALWRLGAAYLEVIAIDPGAPAPDRPRWYGMDRPHGGNTPRLATWVMQVDDPAAARAAAPRDPGPPMRLRRGDLEWDLTVPADGQPVWGGVYPSLIRWPDGIAPPPERLPDAGLHLERFAASGPEGMFADLTALGAMALLDRDATQTTPRLIATIRTAGGRSVSFES